MGSGKSMDDTVLGGAAAALGLKHVDELAKLDRKKLGGFTQRQLFECAKRLNLKGISKLSKDQLAAAVKTELAALGKATAAREKSPAGEQDGPKPATAPAVGAGSAETAWSHKFEIPDHGKEEAPATIPWSYGYDRVTGMAVDPDRLFVYWEVTDDAMERARASLGRGGQSAWLSLRIYDTTDRIFDGTNAHSYFDHRVERGDRHWFFNIGKPSSSAFVDIGLKSSEGYFVKIVRSGRIEFPRREPAPWNEPEWLSVRSLAGPVEHAGRGPHVRRHAPGIMPGPPATVNGPGQPRPRSLVALGGSGHHQRGGAQGSRRVGRALHRRLDRVPSRDHLAEPGHGVGLGGRSFQLSRVRARAGARRFRGAHPGVSSGRPHSCGTRALGGGDQGVGAHQGRAVVARWEIYRSWAGDETVIGQTREGQQELTIPGSSEKLMVGSSERRWRYASEMRLGGASEVYLLGASEFRARGASERMFMGASQYQMRGASERRLAGASELRLGGASERRLGGASERSGASERRLGGASEKTGASEQRLGGASEGRLAAPPSEASSPSAVGSYRSTDAPVQAAREHKE